MKAVARRKYTPEEKIRIVLEGFRREVTVNDLCRREGIKPHSYYSWTKELMEAGKERLTRDSVRDATQLGGPNQLDRIGAMLRAGPAASSASNDVSGFPDSTSIPWVTTWLLDMNTSAGV